MSRKILISYFDWGQDPGATIGGGSWEAQLPAENMLKIQPQLVAQATGSSVSFTLDLGTARSIGIIHLQRLITGVAGTIRVQAGTYDSGTVNSWATDANGTYPPLVYAWLGRPRIFVPDTPVVTSSITVTINAGAAPLQIGYIGACEIYEPQYDMALDAHTTILDEADEQKVPFGSTYITFRAKRRRLDFGSNPLEDNRQVLGSGATDWYHPFFDLTLINGKSSPVIAIPYPDDADQIERNAVWGLFSTDIQIDNFFFGLYRTTAQIDQLV